ncbi:MAG TPA: SH3 domain-containing protein [Leptolyngbyaceae cyanobacterium]
MNLINKKQFVFLGAISCLLLSFSLPIKADVGDPNGINNQPETGWSLWQRWPKINDVDFEIGLSNMDLGGMMDFENACFGEVGTDNTEKKKAETYWFRVNDNIDRYGMGEVKVGCWENDQFKHTITVTAIKKYLSWEDVYCRRVQTRDRNGLVIRSQPNINARSLRRLRNGQTVEISNVPPNITTENNRNWVEVRTPVEGWISNGMVGGEENLKFCRQR